MLGKLILLFTVVPVLELYILIQIGTHIGAFTTIMLVLVTGVTGAFLAKLQGLRVWLTIQKEMAENRLPGDHLIDAVLILAAGVTLITPGLLTDIAGFLILIPVTRAPIRNFVKARLRRIMERGQFNVHRFPQ